MSTTVATRPPVTLPGIPPTPAAPASPARFEDVHAPEPNPAAPKPASDDPDQLAFDAAKKAVDDLEAAGRASEPGAAEPPIPTAARPRPVAPAVAPKAPAAQPRQPFQPMIPKDRFDEALAEANYWKGVAAAHGIVPGAAPAAPGQPPAAPAAPAKAPPHPNTLLASGAKIINDASAAYENGEMTLVEWTAKLFDGLSMIHDGRDALTLGIFRKELLEDVDRRIGERVRPGPADQAILDTQIAEITKDKVWFGVLNEGERKWLQQTAMSEAQARGQPYGNTPADTMRLREHVADLAEQYGPKWHPELTGVATPPEPTGAAAGAPAQPAPQPAPAPAQPRRAATPVVTPAQRAAKVQLAASFPPAGDTRYGARPSGELTLEDVPNLTSDELEALPAATRQRLLGLSPT